MFNTQIILPEDNSISFFDNITLNQWREYNGDNWDMLTTGYVNNGMSIDAQYLQAGDVLICYNVNGRCERIGVCVGGGMYVDYADDSSNEKSYDDLAKSLHVTKVFRPH